VTTTILAALVAGMLLLTFGAPGPGLLVLAALAAIGLFAAWARLRFVGGKQVAFHAHGISPDVVARHEAGHAWAFEAAGGRVDRIETGPGWGITHGTLPRGYTVEDDAFVDYAGEYAAGTSTGCASDRAHARRVLATLPASERSATAARARNRARAAGGGLLFGNSRVDHYANRLRKNGRI
jgi:hypothetical protein